MKHILLYATIFAMCLTAGCGKKQTPGYVSFDGFGLGTSYHITVDGIDTTGLQSAIDSLLRSANGSMSLYDPGSLLSRLNRNETDSVDRHIAYCIETAARVSRMGNGIYDITVAPLTEAWGFAGEEPASRPNVDSLLQYVGYEKIRVEGGRLIKADPAIQLDLNSIAKGYTVDLMGEMIASRGARNYMVEIGGEVTARGVNSRGIPWVISIDRPAEGSMPGQNSMATISLTGKGLATSGNYRRFHVDPDGRMVVHTINARTGESRPTDLLQATIVAENTTLADALATLMMAQGAEKSIEQLSGSNEFSGYLVYGTQEGGMATYISPGMAELVSEIQQ